MDRVCIVGFGVVGQATANVFAIEKHFDIDQQKSNIPLAQVAKCEVIFICLPTNITNEGSYETQSITDIIRQIEQYGTGAVYVIRSTVNPGFALHLQNELGIQRIISNPEFLTEATAEKDSKFPPFVILGGYQGVFLEKIKGLYQGVIKSTKIITTDNTTAEMAKIALNSFFSTKVIFANQIYDFCKTVGANYQTVKEVLQSHPFGSYNHFDVWFKGKRGVNGKCLPKDTKAFGYYSGSDLIKKVMELNQQYISLTENDN